jgi:putative DNA primase/helicase
VSLGKTNHEEFLKFHSLLMRDAPFGYYPFYLVLEQNDKNPLPDTCWSKKSKTVDEATLFLKFGYNIGIAAMPNDKLVIIDVDDPDQVQQVKPTLRAISSKQIGHHNYFFAEDSSAKVNIPTEDAGEVRASGQYVVAPGSFVTRSKEDIDRMPEDRKRFAGQYLLANENQVSEITFAEFPEVYKKQRAKDAKQEEEKAIKKEQRVKKIVREKKSAMWDLTVYDVLGIKDSHRNFPIPVQFHGSDTGKNASISKGLLHCWRHANFHTGLTALAVLAGVASCNEAGYRHGKHSSAVDFTDTKTQYELWIYAYKHGLLPSGDPIPQKALQHYAIQNKLCNENEIIDWWKLPVFVPRLAAVLAAKGGLVFGR